MDLNHLDFHIQTYISGGAGNRTQIETGQHRIPQAEDHNVTVKELVSMLRAEHELVQAYRATITPHHLETCVA